MLIQTRTLKPPGRLLSSPNSLLQNSAAVCCVFATGSGAVAAPKAPGSRTGQSEATDNPNELTNKHLPPNRNTDLTIDRE